MPLTKAQIDALKTAVNQFDVQINALVADGGAPPPPPPNPAIVGFAVAPLSVTVGQSVVLSATVANANQVTLDGAAITLPYTHTPAASRPYQIVATGAAGTIPATSPSIAVTVTAVPPPPPGGHGLTATLDFGGGKVAHIRAGAELRNFAAAEVERRG